MRSLVSNPPFNIRFVPPPLAMMQPRFSAFGVPKTSNYAFVLTGIDLSDDVSAFILPNSVLEEDYEIRKCLIEENVLDAVINLPDKMFESTDIATCILLFSKHKKTKTVEFVNLAESYSEEQRDQNGQYGGKSHENRTYHKTFKVLTDEVIDKTKKAIENRENITGFSHSASYEELKENDFSLRRSKYIQLQEVEFTHRSYSEIAKDFNEIIDEKNSVKLTVNESLAKSLGLYSVFQLLNNQPEVSQSFEIVGEKAGKETFLVLSKNAAEFKIENRNKDKLPEVFMFFLSMWKSHIAYLNNRENVVLSEFRDALLNDLMKGKINVDTDTGDK